MKEMKKYLEDRIKKLEKEQEIYLEQMTETYDEKGYYREMYFKTLNKLIEVQDALLKLYEIEKSA